MADIIPDSTKMNAADILQTYADFIRNDVRSDDFERHPYLPYIEQTIDDLRAAPPAMDREAGEKVRMAINAVTAEMRRLMPNACGDWADRVDALIAELGGSQTLTTAENAELCGYMHGKDYRDNSIEAVAYRTKRYADLKRRYDALSTLSADAIRQGEGEADRGVATSVDDEVTRAFIDGWNARFDQTDFDMALHYWMLSGVTLAPASNASDGGKA